jgi:hypothetical protein
VSKFRWEDILRDVGGRVCGGRRGLRRGRIWLSWRLCRLLWRMCSYIGGGSIFRLILGCHRFWRGGLGEIGVRGRMFLLVNLMVLLCLYLVCFWTCFASDEGVEIVSQDAGDDEVAIITKFQGSIDQFGSIHKSGLSKRRQQPEQSA